MLLGTNESFAQTEEETSDGGGFLDGLKDFFRGQGTAWDWIESIGNSAGAGITGLDQDTIEGCIEITTGEISSLDEKGKNIEQYKKAVKDCSDFELYGGGDFRDPDSESLSDSFFDGLRGWFKDDVSDEEDEDPCNTLDSSGIIPYVPYMTGGIEIFAELYQKDPCPTIEKKTDAEKGLVIEQPIDTTVTADTTVTDTTTSSDSQSSTQESDSLGEVQPDGFYHEEITKAIEIIRENGNEETADRIQEILDDTGAIEVDDLDDNRGKIIKSKIGLGRDIVLDVDLFDPDGADPDSVNGFVDLVDLASTLVHEADHYDNDESNWTTTVADEDRSWTEEIEFWNDVIDNCRTDAYQSLNDPSISNEEKENKFSKLKKLLTKLTYDRYPAYEEELEEGGVDTSRIDGIVDVHEEEIIYIGKTIRALSSEVTTDETTPDVTTVEDTDPDIDEIDEEDMDITITGDTPDETTTDETTTDETTTDETTTDETTTDETTPDVTTVEDTDPDINETDEEDMDITITEDTAVEDEPRIAYENTPTLQLSPHTSVEVGSDLKITIVDSFENKNTSLIEEIEITIRYFDAFVGTSVDNLIMIKETAPNSGVFETIITIVENPNDPTRRHDIAALYHYDTNLGLHSTSETVVIYPPGYVEVEPRIWSDTPTLILVPNNLVEVGSDIKITLVDSFENKNPLLIEEIEITIDYWSGSSDDKLIKIKETDPNSGVFETIITTIENPNDPTQTHTLMVAYYYPTDLGAGAASETVNLTPPGLPENDSTTTSTQGLLLEMNPKTTQSNNGQTLDVTFSVTNQGDATDYTLFYFADDYGMVYPLTPAPETISFASNETKEFPVTFECVGEGTTEYGLAVEKNGQQIDEIFETITCGPSVEEASTCLAGYPKSGDVIVVYDPPYSIANNPDGVHMDLTIPYRALSGVDMAIGATITAKLTAMTNPDETYTATGITNESGETSITFNLPKENASYWGQAISVEDCAGNIRSIVSVQQAFTPSPPTGDSIAG